MLFNKKYDELTLKKYDTRSEMGEAAAREAGAKIKELLAKKDYIRMIFAAAPSQNEFLTALIADQEIDFSRIDAFHMDEYVRLDKNDPHVAFFNDSEAVKLVELDEVCRMQQVNDGCFKSLNEVPKTAITLTIPTLINVGWIFCMVPAKTKAQAVKNSLTEIISETYPASILRKKPNAIMYVDSDSGALID